MVLAGNQPDGPSVYSPTLNWIGYPKAHTGRLYHVQFKPLYEAIGEPDNRNRRPVALGRMIERLMLLDVVLGDKDHTWLGTEKDKLAYFRTVDTFGRTLDDRYFPRLVFGDGPQKTVRYFPDKLPIGIEVGHGRYRHVFVYLVRQTLSRSTCKSLAAQTPHERAALCAARQRSGVN